MVRIEVYVLPDHPSQAQPDAMADSYEPLLENPKIC